MNKLALLFNVEAGEGRLVSLLFLHSFFLGMANNFVQTAAFALFMVEFDAQMLALIYVINALAVPALTFVYLKLGKRLPFSKLLAANLGFLVVLIGIFRLGLGIGTGKAAVFALPVLFQILVNFGSLEFWTLAGRLFNVRQGKRLFGLIGAGQWLAIVLTGLLIPALVAWLGTANLLILAAVSVVGELGLLLYISRAYAEDLAVTAAPGPAQEAQSSANLFKSRYVLLIFGLIVLWWIAFFFIDNVFYAQAAVQYPSEAQYASFLGLFLAVLGVVTLLSNAFLSSLVIGRHGLRVGLLLLPVALVAAVAMTAMTGTLGGSVALLFWLIVVTKIADMALGFSVDRSALTILYQPLPPDKRGQTQTVAEGVFQPLANGLAGLALFGLGFLFPSEVLPLLYVLFFIVTGWLVVAALLGREYPAMLMRALTRRRLAGADLSLTDGASLNVLQQGVQNPHPGVAVYSLNTLEAIGHDSLPALLEGALNHPAPEVRQDALQRIERLELRAALPGVGRRIVQEPSPTVRGAAVRTLAALGGSEAFGAVSAYLHDPNPPVRKGAMVGLLRSGGIEGVLAAGEQLLHMAASEDPTERKMAAEVLGEVGVGSFYQPLLPLLQDRDVQVQRAALTAAGQLKNEKLWPLVVKSLQVRPLWRAAAAALVAGGEAVLPVLSAAWGGEGQPPEVQAQLARISGRIGGERAASWLKGRLADAAPVLRSQVLYGLHRSGFRVAAGDAAWIEEQIGVEAALSARLLAVQADVGDEEATGLLQRALGEALAQSLARIFFLLSFSYDRQAILQARDNLALASGDKRAYALEVLDVLVAQEVKNLFFPLLTDLSPRLKVQQLNSLLPQPQRTCREHLVEIITASPGQYTPWTQACALYALIPEAKRAPADDLSETVTAALSAPDPLLRETAVWARQQLAMPETSEQEEIMLSTIEKVLALKQASIFAETPDEILAEIAAVLEEVPLPPGETIFDKGDPGDCMYLIVDGEVRVHDGGQTLNHLHSGDVFGEMAVLDAEPRMASVTAVVDTQLLRLAQEPLYEVMDDRSEVGRGVIRVLSRHLRARAQDLNDLRGRLEASGRAP